MSLNHWSSGTIGACQNLTGIPFTTSIEALSEASKDFGQLYTGHPAGVVYPKTTSDIAALLQFANLHHLSFTIRSGGYSQGGQTLAPMGGVTLDCSQMTSIDQPSITKQTLTCQPGATWHQVTEVCAPHGFLPKVMPFFPGLTIGGVISIGGVGSNSHLYGCASGNVHDLEVVTGAGNISICSQTEEPDLFEATLGGLGRCSIISKASIKLRPYKPNVVTYYLVYMDHKAWFEDMKTLRDNHCDYLESLCTPSLQGIHKYHDSWKPLPYWLYNLQVSFEYDQREDLNHHKSLLASLGPCHLIHTEFSSTLDFVRRYGTRAKNMKESGSWKLPHPWFECLFSEQLLSEILPELLSRLPFSLSDGLGYRVFHMAKDQPASFMMPTIGAPALGIAALPTGISPNDHQAILDSLEDIHEWTTSLGAKRCLAGWLGSDASSFWQQHFGNYYPQWKILKQRYDPNDVFQSVLLLSSTSSETLYQKTG